MKLFSYTFFFLLVSLHAERPNVLFIAIDDLRPELGCYGNESIRTPHLDAIAAEGTVFTRAYCQQAVCSPSRTSLFTGLRPDTSKVTDLHTHFRETVPDVITLAQHFKMNGYHTESIGKIMHKMHMQDDENSWSVPSRRGKGSYWQSPEASTLRKRLLSEAKVQKLKGRAHYDYTLGPATDAAAVSDSKYSDGAAADLAVRSLQKLKDKEKSFFLALGFVKPHLPFSCPEKYWALYERQKLPRPESKKFPKGSPAMSHNNWGELRGYHDMPKKGQVSEEQAAKLIHGYYACVSFIDAQIGKVTAELKRLGLAENTIIVIWGDHGWKLGDYGAWCKHTAFEVDARVPLIFKVPGQKAARCNALVELVDVYPTLTELCDLNLPGHLEGHSMKPLIEDSSRPWKKAVFSQWPYGKKAMGYSIRTDQWRYTEWQDKSGAVLERELYDHRLGGEESINISGSPEHSAIVKKLSQQLKEGWKTALPDR